MPPTDKPHPLIRQMINAGPWGDGNIAVARQEFTAWAERIALYATELASRSAERSLKTATLEELEHANATSSDLTRLLETIGAGSTKDLIGALKLVAESERKYRDGFYSAARALNAANHLEAAALALQAPSGSSKKPGQNWCERCKVYHDPEVGESCPHATDTEGHRHVEVVFLDGERRKVMERTLSRAIAAAAYIRLQEGAESYRQLTADVKACSAERDTNAAQERPASARTGGFSASGDPRESFASSPGCAPSSDLAPHHPTAAIRRFYFDWHDSSPPSNRSAEVAFIAGFRKANEMEYAARSATSTTKTE